MRPSITRAGGGHLVLHDAYSPDELHDLRAGLEAAVSGSRMLHRSDPNRSDRDRRALLHLIQPAGHPPLDGSRPR